VPEPTLEVRLLRSHSERVAAGAVAARALRDDPLFVYLHGDDPLARMVGAYAAFREPERPPDDGRGLRRLLRSTRSAIDPRVAATVWGALLNGDVIGTAAAAAPGSCFVELLPAEVRTEPRAPEGAPGSPDRLARVMYELCANHSTERHWHVGPVGVEPGLQGRGVGAKVMRLLCDAMDGNGEIAFLETEKPENVVFYRRLGFEVTSESELPGLHTWFMRREPQGKPPRTPEPQRR
jgi:ribosomal protein S18 acetylase RimI-like enzyme